MLANTLFVKSNVIGADHRVDTRVVLSAVYAFLLLYVAGFFEDVNRDYEPSQISCVNPKAHTDVK